METICINREGLKVSKQEAIEAIKLEIKERCIKNFVEQCKEEAMKEIDPALHHTLDVFTDQFFMECMRLHEGCTPYDHVDLDQEAERIYQMAKKEGIRN